MKVSDKVNNWPWLQPGILRKSFAAPPNNANLNQNFKNLNFSAWSKFYSNQKYGNSHDFGDFLGCKNFEIPSQYCMAQYFNTQKPPIPVPPTKSLYQSKWIDLDLSFLGAICLPSSCSSNDVKEIFDVILNEQNLTAGHEIICKTGMSEKSSCNWRKFM